MRNRPFHTLITASALAAGLILMSSAANATPISISASIGGVPTGTNYENFDSLALGSAGGVTASGITVSFTPDGQAVQGSSSGVYAAPYLSNTNGSLFGDPSNGPDTTTYLTTGIGTATLLFPGNEQYMGLLWGSVDSYNTLSFYAGTTLIGSITGSNVTSLANGNQGINGTYYVNINSSTPFDKVVASSSAYAFEFDNVAFNTTRVVPEPAVLGMFGLGLLMIGLLAGVGRRLQ
ncbi:MAG: Npun_F0296 family exosortase-dependent surface protein [Gammaproteobacteria bacterium]